MSLLIKSAIADLLAPEILKMLVAAEKQAASRKRKPAPKSEN